MAERGGGLVSGSTRLRHARPSGREDRPGHQRKYVDFAVTEHQYGPKDQRIGPGEDLRPYPRIAQRRRLELRAGESPVPSNEVEVNPHDVVEVGRLDGAETARVATAQTTR